MALEDIAIPSIILELGKIGKLLQALGLIVVAWIIIQTITLFFNRKRRLMIYGIREDLDRIEKKIDKLLKKGE